MKLKKYNFKQMFKGHQKKLNKRYSYYFVKSTAKPCDKMVDVLKWLQFIKYTFFVFVESH